MIASESAIPPRSMEEVGSSTVSTKKWITLWLLCAGAILAFVSRTNISAALAYKPFVQAFHLTDVGRGALNSSFFWSYAALQIPTGWLVDRYGVKMPYAISFVIWCIASACTGLTHTISQLTTMRVITGGGEAIVTPASYRWMRGNFKEEQAGLAVGVYMLGTKFGPAIGAPLAAWLIVKYDWKLMFILIGAVGIVWLIPWLLFVDNDKPVSKNNAAQKSKPTVTVPLMNLVKSPVIWGTLIINFCYNYFVFYCMTWMPAYFVERRHLSLTKMGLFSFFSFLGIAIVALVSGWVADLLIRRGWDPVATRKAFIIAGFVIACTELLGVRTTSEHAALFWAIVSLSGLGLATANHLALCRLTLIPAAAVGLVSGIQNVATSMAGIVAPLLSGWLKEKSGGYSGPMEAIFFFLVIGALTCLILLRAKWAPVAVVAPANA